MYKNNILNGVLGIMYKQKLMSKNDSVDLDINFFDKYNISSLMAITLVVEIENEFNIIFDREDLLPENHNTLNALVETIKRYIN